MPGKETMSPQETDSLRREVKHAMIDLGLDREGSYKLILPHLTNVSKNQLSMALTGYRNGPAAHVLLEELRRILSSWPPGATA